MFYDKEKKKWEEYPMPIFGQRKAGFHPVLEKRYHEETKVYLFGDADDTTLTRTHCGIYKADLSKVLICSVVGSLAVLFLLSRK